ncbi:MAG: serine/threonine-protein kinase [Planctomycetota bacterium]
MTTPDEPRRDDPDTTRALTPEPQAQPPAADDGDLDTTSVLREPDDEAPLLGKYRLIGSPDPASRKPYAEGGEGRIYLARPLSGGPDVALKTPLPEFARDAARCRRLVKEARQLRSMSHPAIIEVFDIEDEHDPPYYTMTHLPGGSLADRIKAAGQPLDLDEVLRLSIPLADAVRYVHDQKGVSHRDIKPHNVLLKDDGEPVFVDFGLSRDNTGDEATVTDKPTAQTNRFKVGTAMYMAPELFDGKAGNVPTDIYAFGVMLYELATGRRPYEATDFAALEKKKRLQEPVAPTLAHPGLDPRLARVISHALGRRAKERYATMEDLHEDLLAIRDGDEPIHSPAAAAGRPETSAVTAAPRPTRRRGRRLAVLSLLILGSGIGAAYGLNVLLSDDPETVADTTPDHADQETTASTQEAGPTESADDRLAENDTGTTPIRESAEAATEPRVSNQGERIGSTSLAEQQTLIDETSAVRVAPPAPPAPQPTPDPLAGLIGEINAELSKSSPRDAAVADRLGRLADQVSGRFDPGVSEAHRAWLHRAAQTGAADSLALLVTRADDFGNSPDVTLDNGYTWLHSAVASPLTDANFAQDFVAWLDRNGIDPQDLPGASPGVRTPLEAAEFFGRINWQEALNNLKANEDL